MATGCAAKEPEHSDETVRRARLIHSRGYSISETRQHLADEGIEVSRFTLSNWLSWNSRVTAGGEMRETA